MLDWEDNECFYAACICKTGLLRKYVLMSRYLFPVVLNKKMMWSPICKRHEAGSNILITLREVMS
jgi:hypothetical protein